MRAGLWSSLPSAPLQFSHEHLPAICIIDGNMTLHDNLPAFGVMRRCCARLHHFGMLVFGSCVSRPARPRTVGHFSQQGLHFRRMLLTLLEAIFAPTPQKINTDRQCYLDFFLPATMGKKKILADVAKTNVCFIAQLSSCIKELNFNGQTVA